MSRLAPAAPAQFDAVADEMERWKRTKGYPPNSWLTMVRVPGAFRAYRALHTAVMMDSGEVPKALKFMVAYAVSDAAGDPYTAAHNAENAAHIAGVPLEKVEALPQFETSALFTPGERAALGLARATGACPPTVSDAHFAALQQYFSEDAIAELVAVLALIGWLNRWNIAFATRLEAPALEFAARHLAPGGWTPGVHADTIAASTERKR